MGLFRCRLSFKLMAAVLNVVVVVVAVVVMSGGSRWESWGCVCRRPLASSSCSPSCPPCGGRSCRGVGRRRRRRRRRRHSPRSHFKQQSQSYRNLLRGVALSHLSVSSKKDRACLIAVVLVFAVVSGGGGGGSSYSDCGSMRGFSTLHPYK